MYVRAPSCRTRTGSPSTCRTCAGVIPRATAAVRLAGRPGCCADAGDGHNSSPASRMAYERGMWVRACLKEEEADGRWSRMCVGECRARAAKALPSRNMCTFPTAHKAHLFTVQLPALRLAATGSPARLLPDPREDAQIAPAPPGAATGRRAAAARGRAAD